MRPARRPLRRPLSGPTTGPLVYARIQLKFDGTPRGLWHLAGPSPDGATTLRTLCGQILWHEPNSHLTISTRTQAPGVLERCCAECVRRRHVPLPGTRAAM